MNPNQKDTSVDSRETGFPPEKINSFISPITPLKLARLNFTLFSSLYKLGTSKDRICQAISLNSEEFDYLSALGGLSRSE